MALPELRVIGNPANHDQVAMKVVTGQADFAADRFPMHKWYGAPKLSTIMRGKIKSVDATEALKEPGVKAVVTYKEVPGWTQDIFQWGQEVAGVIADNWYTAVRATQLVKVEYEVGVGVFDPDEAAKSGAPLTGIFPDSNTKVMTDLKRGQGGEAGLAKADVSITSTTGWSTTYAHNELETHQSVAWWVGDDVYIWLPSQHIHGSKSAIVNALGMPAHKVHTFTHFTGGGHGGKTGDNSAIVSAAMSKVVNGHPVCFINSRHDNMCTKGRQFAVKSEIKIGAKSDGTFTGIDAKFTGDGGRNAYAPVGNAHFGLKNTFTIPDANMKVTLIGTNAPSRGYWRCVNDPPGAQSYDPAIDKLAEKLNMDPYELRMKNMRPETLPDQDSPNLYWGGMQVKECFEWVHEASGYATKWHKPGAKKLEDGRYHGIAITGHYDSHGAVGGGSRAGIVTMTPDGKVLVNVGGARGCEGGPTMCCHVVAEVMGMKYEDVRLGEWGNTDVSLDAGIQAGSGFTGGAGSAFYNAAVDCRNKVFAAAITKAGLKEIAGITISDLEAKDSEIIYKKDPTKKITYRQAMSGTAPIAGTSAGWNGSATGGVGADGRGIGGAQRDKGSHIKAGDRVNTNGGCAACAEVAVDPETGEVEILNYWNAIDTGRTIFKQGTLKEIGSGVELMICQGLFFGDVYDAATGACISSLYTETLFPTFMDIKTERMGLKDIESDDVAGPYGAHGIGEPCVSNYSAITCAIFNATGVWVDPDKGPMTPDKVLKALGKA